jgi:hypothetical protein
VVICQANQCQRGGVVGVNRQRSDTFVVTAGAGSRGSTTSSQDFSAAVFDSSIKMIRVSDSRGTIDEMPPAPFGDTRLAVFLLTGRTDDPLTVDGLDASGVVVASTTYFLGSAPGTSAIPVTAAPACRDGQISVTPLRGGAAAGSIGQVVQFANTSSSTCTLTGYPGVAALDAAGAQVLQASRQLNGMLGGVQNGAPTPPTVTLAPGAVASATIEGGDNPVGTATACPYYPSFLVTPPGMTQPVKVAVDVSAFAWHGFAGCVGLYVDPVVPGNTGRLVTPPG